MDPMDAEVGEVTAVTDANHHNKAFNTLPAVAGIRRYAAHPLTQRYVVQ